jgi:RimJ/RimL family protein N-acetyltransferase
MLTLHRFAEIEPASWLTLLNDRDVHRHMPLSGDTVWTEAMVADWAAGKDAQWTQNGYGPWALKLDGTFIGWGGFQKEGGEADFGLVLLPAHWGQGVMLFRELLARGRAELPLDPVSILLPPSRVRMKGLARLGFEPAGERSYDGHRFLKFRLRDA